MSPASAIGIAATCDSSHFARLSPPVTAPTGLGSMPVGVETPAGGPEGLTDGGAGVAEAPGRAVGEEPGEGFCAVPSGVTAALRADQPEAPFTLEARTAKV